MLPHHGIFWYFPNEGGVAPVAPHDCPTKDVQLVGLFSAADATEAAGYDKRKEEEKQTALEKDSAETSVAGTPLWP